MSVYSMAPPSGGLTSAPAAFAMAGVTSNSGDNSLPRISRDFAPPSLTDTRRPATALASMNNLDMPKKRLDDMGDNGFQNPFTATSQADPTPVPALSVDPHSVGPDGNALWDSSPASQSPYSANQMPDVPTYSYGGGVPNGLNRSGSAPGVGRPQTSDGLPSYPTHIGGPGMPLPSARSLASQIPGGYQTVPYTSGQMIGGFPAPRYGSFDQAATRYMALGLTPSSSDHELQFVSLAGPAPKKRSRRRYDEIERIYPCGYKGCDKAYGTLNHLNAHVAMQKHGPKRLPAEFKDMRKEWRRKKREEAAVHASKEYSQAAHAAAEAKSVAAMQQQHAAAAAAASGLAPANDYPQSSYSQGWQRSSADSVAPPYGSAPQYSNMSSSVGYENSSDPFAHRGSTGSFLTSAPTWSGSDTRPTTANTVSSEGSPTDGRFAYTVPSWGGLSTNAVYGRKEAPGMPPPPTMQPGSFQPYMMNQQGFA